MSTGLAPTVYDKKLVEDRKTVNDTISEVLTFRFRTEGEEKAAEALESGGGASSVGR